MKEMSPATALRQLQQAQAGLKKARQLLKQYMSLTLTPDDPSKAEAEKLLKATL